MPEVELRKKFSELHAMDQKYRANIETFDANLREQKVLDEQNLLMLEEIVGKFGWPTIAVLGEDLARVPILIAQHSSFLDRSERLYEIAFSTYKQDSRALKPEWLTNWIDSIRVQSQRPLVYGQYFLRRNGEHWVIPQIEDVERLEQRRRSMGLEPFPVFFAQRLRDFPDKADRESLLNSYETIFGARFRE